MTDLAQRRLAAVIRAAGSQRAAAARLGVSAAYLNDVLRGRRAVSARLARALGLERVVSFRVPEGGTTRKPVGTRSKRSGGTTTG